LAEVEPLAAGHLEAIRAVQPAGPYTLGGWSFGGLVAFEMALRLRAEGHDVGVLALLDAVAPGASEASGADEADEDEVEVIAWYAEDFLRFFGKDLPSQKRPALRTADDLRGVEPEERLRYLHGVATAVNGLPRGVGLERVRRYIEVYLINQRAARQYRPRGIYPGAVALFRAAEIASGSSIDAALGWGPWVGGQLSIHEVPGTHDTFIEEPNVPALARKLRLCLDRAIMRRR
jgi:thioesterase domain-containing protein